MVVVCYLLAFILTSREATYVNSTLVSQILNTLRFVTIKNLLSAIGNIFYPMAGSRWCLSQQQQHHWYNSTFMGFSEQPKIFEIYRQRSLSPRLGKVYSFLGAYKQIVFTACIFRYTTIRVFFFKPRL